MEILLGYVLGIGLYLLFRVIIPGLYVVEQNERAVKTVFGRAQRVGKNTTLQEPAFAGMLNDDEKERYAYPQVRVIQPGGPYFRWPWERVHKVSVATELVDIAYDPDDRKANQRNTILEAVTRDQLNIGLRGQFRYTVSEKNLYAYAFGVNRPIAHIIGYFVSVLRERIANFEAPSPTPHAASAETILSIPGIQGISINDLRKNLGELNRHMEDECKSSAARYGITLDAALITAIEPPSEVESALAAINTVHNEVSSEISLAEAAADQKIVQSKRAVEIETLRAEAEVQPLRQLALQLRELKSKGKEALKNYTRNVGLELFSKAKKILFTADRDKI
ncbi:SPFH domain-containing protein [Candidatus Uhrbacteria bacterium]|nr:SPFH domain-containing protein [Candidatus Uhrbacteria bacterium]